MEAPPQIKTEEPPQIQVEELDEVKQTISFNNKDEVMDLGTNKIEILDAPKDVATLEKKSEERSLAELEDDDENLKIGADINISLTNDIVEL